MSNILLADRINVQSVMVHFDRLTGAKKVPMPISKYIPETLAEKN